MEINQCDGCQRGLPKNNYHMHYEIGNPTPLMTCTANRYKESNLGVFEPTRMNTDMPDISKPSQVLYTEEEVKQLCEKAMSQGETNEGCTACYVEFEDWFNQNKKK